MWAVGWSEMTQGVGVHGAGVRQETGPYPKGIRVEDLVEEDGSRGSVIAVR
jgi:hypothetical protein